MRRHTPNQGDRNEAIRVGRSVAMLLALSGCNAGGGSYSYSPSDGSYTITFPGKPEEKTTPTSTAAGTLNLVLATYRTPFGRQEYDSSSTKYPVPSNEYDVQKGLDGVADGQARGINATIISKTTLAQRRGPEKTSRCRCPVVAKLRLTFTSTIPARIRSSTRFSSPTGAATSPRRSSILLQFVKD